MGKILFLITELDIGGAEKNLFRLAVALRERGWDVEVAALSGEGAVGRWLEDASVSVHYVHMDFKASPFAFVRLVRLLRRSRPDILHTFLFHANIAGRLANLFGRVPVVVSSVRVAERRRRSHLWMDFATQMLIDREVCVSEGVRQFTHEQAHVSESKLVVIPNAVEPGRPVKPRALVREELGVAGGESLVLSVGRLDPQKGYTDLVRAAALVKSRHAEAVFAVAGEGPAREEVEAAIEEAEAQGYFRLLGWRADVADLYAAADLFVLPSLWEGMPNALLEASAAGLPVVATAVEGSREVVEDGRTGLLVEPCAPEALADAIATLLSDTGVAARLAEAGRQRVLAEHDVEAFVAAHERLYEQLIPPPPVG